MMPNEFFYFLLGFVCGLLLRLTLPKRKFSMDLQTILAKAQACTTVAESVESMLSDYAQRLRIAVSQNDQATMQAIANELDKNSAELSAAVTANTGAGDPPAPAPAPVPATDSGTGTSTNPGTGSDPAASGQGDQPPA